jgi:hypothetical protein
MDTNQEILLTNITAISLFIIACLFKSKVLFLIIGIILGGVGIYFLLTPSKK